MEWFNNLSTKSKFFFCFSLMILIIFIILLLSYRSLNALNENEIALHEGILMAMNVFIIQNEINSQSELMRLMLTMSPGLQKESVVAIHHSDQKIDEAFQRWKKSRLNGADESTLENLRFLWNQFKQTREKQIIPAIYSHDLMTFQNLNTGESAEQIVRMVNIGEELVKEKEKEANQLMETSSRDYTMMIRSFIGMTMIAVILIIALALLLERVIARPLKEMSIAAGKIASGDLSVEINGKRKDEVGALAKSFSIMVSELRKAFTKIEATNRELDKSNHELIQKNEENEMFVYSVSHDLRSPLINLQGFSRELGEISKEIKNIVHKNDLPPAVQEQIRTLIDGEMEDSLRFIQSGVLRMSHMMDALLRLSRAGRVEYQLQIVETNHLVKQIVDSMHSTIQERGATVIIQKDLPSVWGDPSSLEQIFSNLIGNALNYLDPKRSGMVEIGSLKEGEKAGFHTFYVKDNGTGIPAQSRGIIFQIFQRLHTHHAKGEGVGLAMVKRIVKRHGGDISFESIEGEGSQFFVKLPLPASSLKEMVLS